MRIPSSSLSKTGSKRTEGSGGAGRTQSTQSGAVSSSVGEDVVATGSQNELVAQAMHNGAAARIDHIGQLKSALEAGTYQTDAAEVSRAVVAEAIASGKES